MAKFEPSIMSKNDVLKSIGTNRYINLKRSDNISFEKIIYYVNLTHLDYEDAEIKKEKKT